MSLLVSPKDISMNICVKGLIYGQPGVGKTTLALSAPEPVIIDADKGIYRVEKRFQAPSLPLDDYQAVLDLFASNELDPFKTIIFDTAGKLLDRMAEYLMRNNAKLKQSDGSLSMKGWGSLKMEFQKLLKLAEGKGKHLIFVAHEKEDKDNDTRFIRPDISGSSGKDIAKDLDFIGYMEMRGDKRTISFNPCEKYYAKNALKLNQIISIPDTADKGNRFIEETIIKATIDRQHEEQKLVEQYDEFMDEHISMLANVKDAKSANEFYAVLPTDENAVPYSGLKDIKRALNDKIKELGLSYDAKAKAFIDGKKKEESQDEVSADTVTA